MYNNYKHSDVKVFKFWKRKQTTMSFERTLPRKLELDLLKCVKQIFRRTGLPASLVLWAIRFWKCNYHRDIKLLPKIEVKISHFDTLVGLLWGAPIGRPPLYISTQFLDRHGHYLLPYIFLPRVNIFCIYFFWKCDYNSHYNKLPENWVQNCTQTFNREKGSKCHTTLKNSGTVNIFLNVSFLRIFGGSLWPPFDIFSNF